MKLNTIMLIIAVLLLVACNDNSTAAVENKWNEVMAIHDEVMPETSTIYRLKKDIRELENKDSLALLIIKELNMADEAMMSWMAELNHDKTLSKEEQLRYLETEKEKIQTVSNSMKASIKRARNYLKNKENEN